MMLKELDRQWVEAAAGKIREKMAWVSEKSKNKIPYTTMNGTHDNCSESDRDMQKSDGLNWWTNGFWGGMMWLMYHETGEERYAEIARFSEEKLDQCLEDYYGLHHDVGFMWLLTAVADYRLTKAEDGKRRGMHAANLLAGRFNPAGRFIRAWNSNPYSDNTGWAIIDCMMNVPLLHWATEMTGDPRFKQIAVIHADTAMNHFIRPDGSSEHIVEFDPEQGGVVRTHGGQGYENGSSWTRGQAWGIYGFILSYIRTGKIEYLNTAKRIAHYFIANIPESGLIPIDFRQPREDLWEDSTAAAIAACGFIEIARAVGDGEKDLYLNAALKLLKALDENRCNWSRENDCILEKCSEAYHGTKHINIIYGDYFFMEAIFKLKGNDILLW
ncbi:unsaturated chondroitin disaccharide hydrolase [Anaerotaenia torta]|uniref:glycoside hydrolase family 88 protein n=1 Tax=Anaerotaenia torta TaxID=433293 RepID=UPI003D1DA60B